MISSGVFKEIPAAALPDLVKNLYILNFNTVASSVFFFWDILINLDKELKYIWKSELSYVTVLFGIIRLAVTAAEIAELFFNFGMRRETTDFDCKADYWLIEILGLTIATCINILLISRAYAVYGRNKIVLGSLCTMQVIVSVAVGCLILLALPKVQNIVNPFSHQLPVVLCITLSTPNIETYIWLPIIFFQAIVFFLVMGRHVHFKRNGLKFSSATTHIYHTFIRDGVWDFFLLLACLLPSTIGYSLHSVLGVIALRWTYALAGITASHLIMNLRSANDETEGQTTLRPFTDMKFISIVEEGTESIELATRDTHQHA